MRQIALILLLNFFYLLCISQTNNLDFKKVKKRDSFQEYSFIITSDTLEKYTLKHIEFIPDSLNQYEIGNLTSKEFSKNFISANIDLNNQLIYEKSKWRPIKSKVYWIRLTIKNYLNYDKEWFIKIMNDHASLYILNNDSSKIFTVKKTGNKLPMSERNINYISTPLIKLLVHKNKEQTFYIRTESYTKDKPIFDISLINITNFFEWQILWRTIIGIFLGILSLMIVYQLILYFSLKDSVYLYYVLFSFSFGIVTIDAYGYGLEFLWSNHPNWKEVISVLFSTLYLFFYVVFTIKYLNTKEQLIIWNRILQIWCIIILIFGVGYLIIYNSNLAVSTKNGFFCYIPISWGNKLFNCVTSINHFCKKRFTSIKLFLNW